MNPTDLARIRRLVFQTISKLIAENLELDADALSDIWSQCNTVEEVAVARATVKEVSEAILNFPVEVT